MSDNKHCVPRFIFAGLIIALFFLAGCSALMESTGGGPKKAYGLTESSYAAADMLIQQSKSFVTQETPLEIGILTDLDNPNEKTNFSRMVSEQIASRFVQLGYNVMDSYTPTMMPPAQEGSLPMSYNQQNNASTPGRGAITGRYAVARNEVLVNLRIVEVDTGKILAAYDYRIPNSRDVRQLTKTQADKDSFFNF